MSIKDHGYAWVVCAASFFAHVLHCNLLYSRGMFYIIFSQNFKGDSSTISLVPSLNTALTFGFAPIAGLLVSKFGPRAVGVLGGLCTSVGLILASRATAIYHLYLTYGILTGIGIALIYNPCIVVLPLYFHKQLGLATGIAVSGCGVGFVAFQYLITCLDDEYGWKGTLLILGGIQLNCLVCAALYRPTSTDNKSLKNADVSSAKPLEKMRKGETNNDISKNSAPSDLRCSNPLIEKGLNEPAEEGVSCLSRIGNSIINEAKVYWPLLKNPTFMLFSFGQLFNVTADSIIYTHLGAFALTLNYSKSDAAFLFTIMGISNTIMRLMAGVAAQKIPPLWLCTVATGALAGLTAALPAFRTLQLLVFYVICFGTFCAPYHTLGIVVTSSVIQPEALSRAVGFQVALLSPGSILGPLFAGVLYDYTNLHHASFYMASGFMTLSAISAALGLIINRYRHKNCPSRSTSKDV